MNHLPLRLVMLIVVSVFLASTGRASAQIVALGSSTVQGAVPANEMWPAVLEGILHGKGSQVHVTNAGVWGETTDRTLARVSSAVPDGTKTVILMVNAYNDSKQLSLPRFSDRSGKHCRDQKSTESARDQGCRCDGDLCVSGCG